MAADGHQCQQWFPMYEQPQCHGPGAVFMSGGITYGGHISMPDITELELGPSENSYSRAR